MGIKKLGGSDLAWVPSVLEKAFTNDPMFLYLFGEQMSNQTKMEWVHGSCYKAACLYGECYATEDNSGVLLMFPPKEVKLTFIKMAKGGMLRLPFKFGFRTLSNFMTLMDHVEQEHSKVAPFDHYYIWILGVLPDQQRKGVGKELLQYALERVDRMRLPCYLETQNVVNLGFYQQFGFSVVSDSQLPKGDLQNWGLLRKASSR